MGELRQFQSVTACKFVHHNQIDYEINERTDLCIYLSKHNKFWAFELDFVALAGPINFCLSSPTSKKERDDDGVRSTARILRESPGKLI